MASINSHRRRQVTSYNTDRRTRRSSASAPIGAAIMMPDKDTMSNSYSTRRIFADLNSKLYAVPLVRKTRDGIYTNGGQYPTADIIQPHPAGTHNVHQRGSTQYYHYSRLNTGSATQPKHPPVYAINIAPGATVLDYTRKQMGLLANASHDYKPVRTPTATNPKAQNYQYVMDIASYIGGNIKSRQATLRWVAGMWREKK